VRTHDLEKNQEIINERVASLEAGEAARDARFDAIDEKLDKVLQFQEDHPPFLYLMRYRTSSTVKWIVIVLAAFVILWTTGALSQLFSLFGL
jgi:hypothetical protein